MPLTWNEIRVRAAEFARYEERVKVNGEANKRIDLLWPGKLLAEHKTRGRDLDGAYQQAAQYITGLEDHEKPQYVVVSDFARIRLRGRTAHRIPSCGPAQSGGTLRFHRWEFQEHDAIQKGLRG